MFIVKVHKFPFATHKSFSLWFVCIYLVYFETPTPPLCWGPANVDVHLDGVNARSWQRFNLSMENARGQRLLHRLRRQKQSLSSSKNPICMLSITEKSAWEWAEARSSAYFGLKECFGKVVEATPKIKGLDRIMCLSPKLQNSAQPPDKPWKYLLSVSSQALQVQLLGMPRSTSVQVHFGAPRA